MWSKLTGNEKDNVDSHKMKNEDNPSVTHYYETRVWMYAESNIPKNDIEYYFFHTSKFIVGILDSHVLSCISIAT